MRIHRLLGSFVAAAALLLSAQPSRAQATAVTVTEDANMFTLDNGIVTAMVSKKSGDLVSMKYRGLEMFATVKKPDGTPDVETDPPGDPGRGRGMTDHMYGFWSHDAVAARSETKVTIDPSKNGGERAEVSVKAFSDGKNLGFGPGAGPDGNFAADIDIRYTLGRGESGIYTYCEFDHKAEYPDASMGEARFCTKLNEFFDWMLVDSARNRLYPADAERNGDNKYNYTAVQWEHPAFGWASTSRNVGFFFVNASVEYLTGPPTKVEFLCHRDTNQIAAPCVLNYWRSSHYGGASVDVAKGEQWKKVIGPFLLYCNSGGDPQSLWADAVARQRTEAAAWPYNWVAGVDYPVGNQRSTVSGQLVLHDTVMPDAKMSNIRVGLSAPDYTIPLARPAATNAPRDITWQLDAKHYEFWVRADAAGTFEIPAVRPGKYTLHAFADGVLGEYAKTDVVVEAGKPLDLGKINWTPVRRGKQVWEIGIPNRSGGEFLKGDDNAHDNMARVYATLFPNDVNYVIGRSEFARDWYFEHVPHMTLPAPQTDPLPQELPARRGFGGFGAGPARGPATRGAGGAPQVAGAGAPAAGGPAAAGNAPTTRGARAGRGGGAGLARGGAVPGGAAPAGGGSRPSPWTISFDLPSAPKGVATLRFGIATANTNNVGVQINDQAQAGLNNLPTESSMGRNANRGIWFERDISFPASQLKAGTNKITLTVPAGGGTSGIIYDYIRLELDENAQAMSN